MRKSWAALAVLVTLSVTGCGYNTFQSNDEQIKASWSEVVNQYQRRADLVPNLVNTVKGFAAQEKEVLLGVTNARAKVGSIQATPELINSPEAFAKFQAAQGELSGALSRLLVVSENYPQLKSDANFRDLQAQLEGTENRIAVARPAVRQIGPTGRALRVSRSQQSASGQKYLRAWARALQNPTSRTDRHQLQFHGDCLIFAHYHRSRFRLGAESVFLDSQLVAAHGKSREQVFVWAVGTEPGSGPPIEHQQKAGLGDGQQHCTFGAGRRGLGGIVRRWRDRLGLLHRRRSDHGLRR